MKRILFAALLATVAVGGAFAAKTDAGNQYYSDSSNTADIDCTGSTASCAAFVNHAWDKPADDPTRTQISLAELASVQFDQ